MKIQVIGPGCARCETLYQNAKEAAGRVGGAEVEHVKNLEILYKLGVFVTPALVIDDQVISSGKVLSPEEIEAQLRGNQ